MGRLWVRNRLSEDRAYEEVPAALSALLVKKFGTPKAFLGSGEYANAWGLQDGSVLKVTEDGSDANAASYWIGKRHANIAPIYGVWQYANRFYIIHMHYAEPLPKPLAKEMNRIERELGDDDDNFEDLAAKSKVPLVSELGQFVLDYRSRGISYDDLHPGNVGFLNGHIVLFDLGLSSSPARSIPRLEVLAGKLDSLCAAL